MTPPAQAQGWGTTIPGPDATLSAAPPYSCRINRYVNGATGNDSNPGTAALPWKTIQNADNGYPNVPVAGECINVEPGTYQITHGLNFGHGGNRNSPTGYVVYRSTTPLGAHIIAGPGINGNDMIVITVPYLIFDGFEIDGNNSLTSGNGINGCAGGGSNSLVSHHFIAINNSIHDMGGAGLTSCAAEYLFWQHNTVYNTSSTSGYQVSGIDITVPAALAAGSYTKTAADVLPYNIVVAYNIAYSNSEGPSIASPHTDGNGIIIDTSFGSSSCPTCGTPYPGNILILGNLAYNNGGGGIHIFLSQNVTVANNTVYSNYRDLLNPGKPRGELSNVGSANTTWINNIAIANPGSGVLAGSEPITSFPIGSFKDSGTWSNNLTYGATNTSDSSSYLNPSTNLIGVAPQLTNITSGNFTPLPGSPVIGAGLPEPFLRSATPNIGAY
jgi:parallel beta-helix repeat protein